VEFCVAPFPAMDFCHQQRGASLRENCMGTVAVFGGSGRLGRLIVRRVAQDAPVRFTFLSQADAAAAFAAELRAQGRDVEAVRVDVRDAAEVAAFLRATAAVDGRLAGIVSANGNRFPVRPLQDVDEGDFRRIVEVDVFGNFHVLQAGTRLLAAQGGGAIVVLLTAAILRTATCDGMSSIPKARP
jgi:NAD(P)-dependent dehydrogenase (short-subunit alcohol dehydrogenase family)